MTLTQYYRSLVLALDQRSDGAELEPVCPAWSQDYSCGKAKNRFGIGTGSEPALELR